MNEWSDGYVADIDYSSGFYHAMTPAALAFALLERGLAAPDLRGRFTYCELGCGLGRTACVSAAANPGGTFWANDFNPSHIAAARRLASAAGLENIRFYDASFEEFRETELPEFDFVTLHGVFSWVSAQNRAAIVRFLRERLKPGGVAYVSYNAMPAWGPYLPLRRLLVEHGATSSDALDLRVERALAFAEQLRQAGARYFAANEDYGAWLDNQRKFEKSYLAHEYFPRDFTPLYYADVARELSEAKLSYAGSAQALQHLDAINLDERQQALLAGIGDPVFRETVRDFIVNRQFRRDVFVKGRVALEPVELHRRWHEARFVLATSRAEAPQKVKGYLGEVTLHAEVYGPLLDALAHGPASFAALAADPRLAPLGFERLRDALVMLVGAEYVYPCLPLEGEAGRAVVTRRYNGAVVEASSHLGGAAHLASPVTGSGHPVHRITQLFLAAHANGRQDLAEYAWQQLSAQGGRLTHEGKRLESAEENLAQLGRFAEEFMVKGLPPLRQLGIA